MSERKAILWLSILASAICTASNIVCDLSRRSSWGQSEVSCDDKRPPQRLPSNSASQMVQFIKKEKSQFR